MRHLAALLLVCAACSVSPRSLDLGAQAGGGKVDPAGKGDAATLPRLANCTGHDFTPDKPGSWNHFLSRLIALGDPAHSADDVLAVAGTAPRAAAKIVYGPLFKELEDERVEVFIDTCDGWHKDGVETTSDDGVVAHTFAALPDGVYDVRFEVVGDGSLAPARLWVLPQGTHLVVYDIDGTLTTSDAEEIKQIFDGDYVPQAYPAAAELTHAYLDKGAIGLYLTGRPHWLMDRTREWLDDQGFAAGAVHLTQEPGEVLPTNGGVGDFKLHALQALVAQGFILDAAHGNTTTDIYAYEGAGIPGGQIWIIGSVGGEQGTHAVAGDWSAHAHDVEAGPPVGQPFSL